MANNANPQKYYGYKDAQAQKRHCAPISEGFFSVDPEKKKTKYGNSLLLYGQPGSGKTAFALMASKPLFVFSFDGGLFRIKDAVRNMYGIKDEEIDYDAKYYKSGASIYSLLETEKDAWLYFLGIIKALPARGYKTVIFDGMGDLYSFMCKYLTAREERQIPPGEGKTITDAPHGRGWIMIGETFDSFVNEAFKLSTERGINLIFVDHEKESIKEDGGTEIVEKGPITKNSRTNSLFTKVDMVLPCIDGKEIVYRNKRKESVYVGQRILCSKEKYPEYFIKCPTGMPDYTRGGYEGFGEFSKAVAAARKKNRVESEPEETGVSYENV